MISKFPTKIWWITFPLEPDVNIKPNINYGSSLSYQIQSTRKHTKNKERRPFFEAISIDVVQVDSSHMESKEIKYVGTTGPNSTQLQGKPKSEEYKPWAIMVWVVDT